MSMRFHADMPEPIESPRCPLCSARPVLVLDRGRQAFCGTEGCPTFTWDTTKPLDELLLSAIALRFDADPDDEPYDEPDDDEHD